VTRYLVLVSLILLQLASTLHAQPSSLLQRDWMVGLVEGLGWSFGLPDEPDDDDYLRILSGRRTYRYEAEALCRPDDLVSVKKYRAYGYCSGEAWLSGISRPTTAHLQILVPIGGTFEVTIRLRRPGHSVEIAGQSFATDAGEMFEDKRLGEITLEAGLHDVLLRLPIDGAVDYLELSAPQLPPISPRGGWQPDTPLRLSDLAVTASQLLALEDALVPSGQPVVYQAEAGKLFEGAVITDIRHLGEPDGGSWVRAGNLDGRLSLTLEVPEGVYRLSLRGMGERPLRVEIPGLLEREVEVKPYLMEADLGPLHLVPGQRLTVYLPPRCGVDRLTFEGFRSTPLAFLRLTGLAAQDGPATTEQLDALLALLVQLAPRR